MIYDHFLSLSCFLCRQLNESNRAEGSEVMLRQHNATTSTAIDANWPFRMQLLSFSVTGRP